ncbi:hypothetical protein KR009_011270 [Drosophila setifemur]|nr:hypothetical protein KR009_011270 [Drosophila setifemur]
MSLDGARLRYVDENGETVVVPAKGRTFQIGAYLNCDLVLGGALGERLICEIQRDPFGRVYLYNKSIGEPIHLDDKPILQGKRQLLHGGRIKILDHIYTWEFPKNVEVEDALSTPERQTSVDQASNSCPSLKVSSHRLQIDKRLTVHNFHYSINSDDEGNTSVESRDQDVSLAELDQSLNFSTPPSTEQSSCETPKVDLLEATQNKENTATPPACHKKLLKLCALSDVVITSFSPRETGVKIEKSFTCVRKPATATMSTPKSVYSTPKGVLSELNDDSCSRDLVDFSTPSTSKKAVRESSMYLIDLTTPTKMRPTLRQLPTPISVESTDESSDASPLVIDITKTTTPPPPAQSKSKTSRQLTGTPAGTPKRTPQSLMKRALLTSTKKQIAANRMDSTGTPVAPPKRPSLLEARRQCLTTPRRLPFHPHRRTPVHRADEANRDKAPKTSPRKRKTLTLDTPRENKLSQLRKSLAAAKRSPGVDKSNKLVAKARRSLNSPKLGSPKPESPRQQKVYCMPLNKCSTPEKPDDSTDELSRTFTILDEDEGENQTKAVSMIEAVADLVTDGPQSSSSFADVSHLLEKDMPISECMESSLASKVESKEETGPDANESETKEEYVKEKAKSIEDLCEGQESSSDFLVDVLFQSNANKMGDESPNQSKTNIPDMESPNEIEEKYANIPSSPIEEQTEAVVEESICEEITANIPDAGRPSQEKKIKTPSMQTPIRRSSRCLSVDQRAKDKTPRRSLRRASMEATKNSAKVESTKKPVRRASCSSVGSQEISTPRRKTSLTEAMPAPSRQSSRLINTPKRAHKMDESVGDMGVIVEEPCNEDVGKSATLDDEDYGNELPTEEEDKVDYLGLRDLMKTPKSCSTPRFKGLREMMRTPKIPASPILDNIDELLEHSAGSTPHHKSRSVTVSRVEVNEGKALDRILKTPSARNIMVPNDPASAVLKYRTDSLTATTEYNLSMGNTTLHLDKIFDDVPGDSEDTETEINVTAVSTASGVDPLGSSKRNESVSSEVLMSVDASRKDSFSIKDPLTSTTYKAALQTDLELSSFNKEGDTCRPVSPNEHEMSGIQLLDQTSESMFSEPLIVSASVVESCDDTIDETKVSGKTILLADVEDRSDTDSNVGLMEPLVLSDEEEQSIAYELEESSTQEDYTKDITLDSKGSDKPLSDDDKSLVEVSLIEVDDSALEDSKNATKSREESIQGEKSLVIELDGSSDTEVSAKETTESDSHKIKTSPSTSTLTSYVPKEMATEGLDADEQKTKALTSISSADQAPAFLEIALFVKTVADTSANQEPIIEDNSSPVNTIPETALLAKESLAIEEGANDPTQEKAALESSIAGTKSQERLFEDQHLSKTPEEHSVSKMLNETSKDADLQPKENNITQDASEGVTYFSTLSEGPSANMLSIDQEVKAEASQRNAMDARSLSCADKNDDEVIQINAFVIDEMPEKVTTTDLESSSSLDVAIANKMQDEVTELNDASINEMQETMLPKVPEAEVTLAEPHETSSDEGIQQSPIDTEASSFLDVAIANNIEDEVIQLDDASIDKMPEKILPKDPEAQLGKDTKPHETSCDEGTQQAPIDAESLSSLDVAIANKIEDEVIQLDDASIDEISPNETSIDEGIQQAPINEVIQMDGSSIDEMPERIHKDQEVQETSETSLKENSNGDPIQQTFVDAESSSSGEVSIAVKIVKEIPIKIHTLNPDETLSSKDQETKVEETPLQEKSDDDAIEQTVSDVNLSSSREVPIVDEIAGGVIELDASSIIETASDTSGIDELSEITPPKERSFARDIIQDQLEDISSMDKKAFETKEYIAQEVEAETSDAEANKQHSLDAESSPPKKALFAKQLEDEVIQLDESSTEINPDTIPHKEQQAQFLSSKVTVASEVTSLQVTSDGEAIQQTQQEASSSENVAITDNAICSLLEDKFDNEAIQTNLLNSESSSSEVVIGEKIEDDVKQLDASKIDEMQEKEPPKDQKAQVPAGEVISLQEPLGPMDAEPSSSENVAIPNIVDKVHNDIQLDEISKAVFPNAKSGAIEEATEGKDASEVSISDHTIQKERLSEQELIDGRKPEMLSPLHNKSDVEAAQETPRHADSPVEKPASELGAQRETSFTEVNATKIESLEVLEKSDSDEPLTDSSVSGVFKKLTNKMEEYPEDIAKLNQKSEGTQNVLTSNASKVLGGGTDPSSEAEEISDSEEIAKESGIEIKSVSGAFDTSQKAEDIHTEQSETAEEIAEPFEHLEGTSQISKSPPDTPNLLRDDVQNVVQPEEEKLSQRQNKIEDFEQTSEHHKVKQHHSENYTTQATAAIAEVVENEPVAEQKVEDHLRGIKLLPVAIKLLDDVIEIDDSSCSSHETENPKLPVEVISDELPKHCTAIVEKDSFVSEKDSFVATKIQKAALDDPENLTIAIENEPAVNVSSPAKEIGTIDEKPKKIDVQKVSTEIQELDKPSSEPALSSKQEKIKSIRLGRKPSTHEAESEAVDLGRPKRRGRPPSTEVIAFEEHPSGHQEKEDVQERPRRRGQKASTEVEKQIQGEVIAIPRRRGRKPSSDVEINIKDMPTQKEAQGEPKAGEAQDLFVEKEPVPSTFDDKMESEGEPRKKVDTITHKDKPERRSRKASAEETDGITSKKPKPAIILEVIDETETPSENQNKIGDHEVQAPKSTDALDVGKEEEINSKAKAKPIPEKPKRRLRKASAEEKESTEDNKSNPEDTLQTITEVISVPDFSAPPQKRMRKSLESQEDELKEEHAETRVERTRRRGRKPSADVAGAINDNNLLKKDSEKSTMEQPQAPIQEDKTHHLKQENPLKRTRKSSEFVPSEALESVKEDYIEKPKRRERKPSVDVEPIALEVVDKPSRRGRTPAGNDKQTVLEEKHGVNALQPEKKTRRNARKASAEPVKEDHSAEKEHLLQIDEEGSFKPEPEIEEQNPVLDEEPKMRRRGRKPTAETVEMPTKEALEHAMLPRRRLRKATDDEIPATSLAVESNVEKSKEVEPIREESKEEVPQQDEVPAQPHPELKQTRRGRKPSEDVDAKKPTRRVRKAAANLEESTPVAKKTTTRRGRKVDVDEDALEKQIILEDLPTDSVAAVVISKGITSPGKAIQEDVTRGQEVVILTSSPSTQTEDELTPRRREGRNLPRKNYDETSDEDKPSSATRRARKPAAIKVLLLSDALPVTPQQKQLPVEEPITPLNTVALVETTTSQRREGRNLPRKNYTEAPDEDKPSSSRARRLRNPTAKALEMIVNSATRSGTPKRRRGKAVDDDEPMVKKSTAEAADQPQAMDEDPVPTPGKGRNARRKADEITVTETKQTKTNARATSRKAKVEAGLAKQPPSKKARGGSRAKSPAAARGGSATDPEEEPAKKPAARSRARLAKAAPIVGDSEQLALEPEVEASSSTGARGGRARKVHFEMTLAPAEAASSEHAPKRATRSRRK